jgi:hypothetical protein
MKRPKSVHIDTLEATSYTADGFSCSVLRVAVSTHFQICRSIVLTAQLSFNYFYTISMIRIGTSRSWGISRIKFNGK